MITRITLAGLVEAACALVIFCTVAGFFGGWVWALDIFDHFRLHYAAGALLFGALAWWTSRHRWALTCLVVLVVNVMLCPNVWSFHRAVSSDEKNDRPFRVASINVLTSNRHYSNVVDLIRRENPDAALLLEVDAVWLAELSALDDHYKLIASRPRDDNFGIALYVRREMDATAELFFPGIFGMPAVDANINLPDGRHVRLIGLHTTPPWNPGYDRDGRATLDEVAEKIAGMEGPVMLIGDFNVTPWSGKFRRLLARSGLIDSASGHGYLATWPTLASRVLRIPIDHCLVSPEIKVARRWTGPEVGSDHLPLLVDVIVAPD